MYPLRIYSFLRLACSAYAAWFILCFLFVAAFSSVYPFHLEWMEGHVMEIVRRVREGQGIYVEPSLAYVPYLYTPFYYYAAAAASLIFGLDFFAARFVSIIAIITAAFIMYRIVQRETNTRWMGFIAIGLFAASYPLSGRWFDVARVDSLFLCLSMASAYMSLYAKRERDYYLAGAFFALAFFTKQTALVIAFPVLAAWLLVDARRSLAMGAALSCLVAAGLALMHVRSGGWSSFYILELPSLHRFDSRYTLGFWKNLVYKDQIIPLLLSLVGIVFMLRTRGRQALPLVGLFVGLVLASYTMRINVWSYINVYMPMHFAYALFAALALVYLSRVHVWLVMVACAALIIHFHSGIYMAVRYVPDRAAREQGEAFLAGIAQVEGEVLIPDLHFVQGRVGKKSYAYGMAAFDVLHTDLKEKNYLKAKLKDELAIAIANQQFAAVTSGKVTRMPYLKRYYAPAGTLSYPTEFLTGIVKPETMQIYLPRR